MRDGGSQTRVATCLRYHLPKRLAAKICRQAGIDSQLTVHNDNRLEKLGEAVNGWQLLPEGTEGHRTVKVTLGGVHKDDLSASTMQAKHFSGPYFIGEVVDVTGHRSGNNFQRAWSGSFMAGQHVFTMNCQRILV